MMPLSLIREYIDSNSLAICLFLPSGETFFRSAQSNLLIFQQEDIGSSIDQPDL